MPPAVDPSLQPGVRATTTTVEIVVPVHNEERTLDASVRRLRTYLDEHFPFTAVVTVADNASTDGTWAEASRLAAQLTGVQALHLDQKGRGRALRVAWSASEAAVVAYMDVDLSTDLDAILPLVAPLISGHSDVAIGSRLARGARVMRGTKRELISRAYNLVIRAAVGNRFSDAQCGFKALRTDVARALIPAVEDNDWFFDTELLVLAEHNGLRIHEVPVDWVDDPDSRVDIVATALGDLRGLWRLTREMAAGKGRITLPDRSAPGVTARFVGIGGLSTLAYLLAFLALRGPLGGVAASAVSLTACSLANFAAHYRVGLGGRRRAVGPFASASVVAWLVGLALTSLGLVVADAASGSALAAVIAVITANGVVSVGRFVALRATSLRRHLDGPGPSRT